MPEPRIAQAATVFTSDGPFRIIANAVAIIASGWADTDEQPLKYVSSQLLPTSIDNAPAVPNAVLTQAIAAVEAYYAGDPSQLAKVPVCQRSGPFREKLWNVMHTIPAGEQVSYAELAGMAGNPRAARAAGGACSHNSIPLFVPCHRVLTSAGTLGGFAYGLDLKKRLLDHETTFPVDRVRHIL